MSDGEMRKTKGNANEFELKIILIVFCFSSHFISKKRNIVSFIFDLFFF